jgi:hypothetical protein
MNPEAAGSGGMKKTVIIVILFILLVASVVFGFQQYSKAKDYKDNVDKKISAALAQAQAAQAKQVQDDFDKANTKPFNGSYGSISFNYPKTWSAYVDTSGSSDLINGYFQPDTVPGIQSKTAYALRVELLNSDYSQVMQQLNSQVKNGSVTAAAYVPPKLKGNPNVVPGTFLKGKVNNSDQTQVGQMAVIKIRDKTLEIYTENMTYANDFNNIILASLNFAP